MRICEQKLVWIATIGLFGTGILGCGGSAKTSSGSPPSPTATSGEYLFEGNSTTGLNLSSIDPSTGAISPPDLLAVGIGVNTDSSYPGMVATPSKKFLYAFFSTFTLMQAFAISGPGLNVIPLNNTPFSLVNPGPLNSMTMHPSGRFLFTVLSPSTIEEDTIDPVNGNLIFSSDTTEPLSDFRVAVIDPTGKFLYVTDPGPSKIFGYQISQADGSLSGLPGSPFSLPLSNMPNIPAIDSSGKFLYASLIGGGVAAYSIDGSSGALTSIPGSLFITSGDAGSITADPAAEFIYICNSNGSIDGFAVNSVNGALTTVPGSPFSTASTSDNITVDPSGKFLYVSNFSGGTIYGFRVDSVSGSLSPVAGSPFSAIPEIRNLYVVKIP